MQPAVYILANRSNRVLYVGVTSNLRNRVRVHVQHLNPGSFSDRYNVTKLVYYELLPTMWAAIAREKQIKGGSRADKVLLVERANADWRDLAGALRG